MARSNRSDAGTGRADANLSSASSASGSSSSQDNSASDGVPRRTCLQTQLRKTKLCMYFLRGACQYGRECAFAHTVSELQATPDLRKTRLCVDFVEGRGCTNDECSFAHGEAELRSTDLFYKKSLCIWHEKGRCRNGDQCRFAHGLEELYEHLGVSPPAAPECAQQAAVLGRENRAHGAQEPVARAVPAMLTGSGVRAQWKQEEALGFVDLPSMEPMKIRPGRNLLEVPGMYMPEAIRNYGVGGQAGGDGLLTEIDRLRDAISALTMHFSAMKQSGYSGLPPPSLCEVGVPMYPMPIPVEADAGLALLRGF